MHVKASYLTFVCITSVTAYTWIYLEYFFKEHFEADLPDPWSPLSSKTASIHNCNCKY